MPSSASSRAESRSRSISSEARPRSFLLENVFGLAYRNHNAFWFKRLLATFRELGYQVDHQVLLAADFGVMGRVEMSFS